MAILTWYHQVVSLSWPCSHQEMMSKKTPLTQPPKPERQGPLVGVVEDDHEVLRAVARGAHLA